MKYLQADLSSLFKPSSLPPSNIQLPSGPAFTRPMRIKATKIPICYSYEFNWLAPGIHITFHELTIEQALQLSRPKFADKLTNYRIFLNSWVNHCALNTRYFRTLDDLYIDAFIQSKVLQKTHTEFPRIKLLYPEYFI